MTHAVLYNYVNCTDDKLLALALVTNYITNCSKITAIIIIITVIIIVIIIIIIITVIIIIIIIRY